ncbi:MAG: GNAT family N-acetyltransferase [Lachnospiraceae bacterium]
MEFKNIAEEDSVLLRSYYKNCDYVLCEYSFGTKLMWRDFLNPAWTEAAGCLIVRNTIRGSVTFDYPVAGKDGDEEAALSEIEKDCMEKGIPLIISIVPEKKLSFLISRYPYCNISNIRTWKDYIYRAVDLREFAGKSYAKRRNHAKKFHTLYPEAVFRPLTGADTQAIEQFWENYLLEFPKNNSAEAMHELTLARGLFKTPDADWLLTGGIFIGEKLIALELAEKCKDILIIHIEKALYSYEGVYPALVQEFCREFAQDVTFVNREDDAANKGLRNSKMQYVPVALASKYQVKPQNEFLMHLKEIPVLRTERLVLSELTEADIPDYNALILDTERNHYWGYDDLEGLAEPMKEDSFYQVAQRDLKNGTAFNFAIRLDGKLIGEAVFYHFDYKGAAELGCRIAAGYAGCGYGTEAFLAAADWGLYSLHLYKVVAKCFHENEASYKMLSSCMKHTGKDDTYDYFEKTI